MYTFTGLHMCRYIYCLLGRWRRRVKGSTLIRRGLEECRPAESTQQKIPSMYVYLLFYVRV